MKLSSIMGKSNQADNKKQTSAKSVKSSNKKQIELEKEKIESDNENDSDNEENQESDSDSDGENENQIQEEDQEEDQELDEPETSEKKVHTFDSIFEEITTVRKDISGLESDKIQLISDHEKQLKEILTDIKKKKSEENKLIANIPKIHKKEISVAKKERRKRNGENKGGFNKETIVPDILRKFLDLDEGKMLARPKVMSLLNSKFIELGLKKGQEVELDKKTAKKFGLKEGHVIGFTEFQRFIADQYPKKVVSVDL